MIKICENKNILVVEDEQDIVQVLVKYFYKHAPKQLIPYVAMDGYEALETLRALPIDLIILDIKMMNLDGMEVCRQAQKDENMKKIPIIITSGHLDQDKRRELDSMGITHIFDKPYMMEDLISRIDYLIGPNV